MRPSVFSPGVCPETLTRYREKYLMDFHQTYTSDTLWDRDGRGTFLGQKVKVQGHGRISCSGNSSLRAGHTVLDVSRRVTVFSLDVLCVGTRDVVQNDIFRLSRITNFVQIPNFRPDFAQLLQPD